ncbi:MAG: biotin synthesis protein bioC [Pseudomonadota bacterium]
MSLPPNESDSSPQIAPISVARVRQLFAQPSRVAESQFLRREIAGRMFERLALIKTRPSRILDAGCGEGQDLLGLHQAFPHAALVGMDASPAMLAEARRAVAQSASGMQRVLARLLVSRAGATGGAALACADFGRLPLPPASIDLLWSNLALHWHPQPHAVIREWARVLRTDGLLMFCCFGPDTFKELRAAFAATGRVGAADGGEGGRDAHVLPFVDLHDYGDMLVAAGFETPVMDMEKLTITYSTTDKLLADVRAFGGNPLFSRVKSLQGRGTWQTMIDALMAMQRPDGTLPLTIEVIYGHAFKPRARVTAAGESIIRFDLKRN